MENFNYKMTRMEEKRIKDNEILEYYLNNIVFVKEVSKKYNVANRTTYEILRHNNIDYKKVNSDRRDIRQRKKDMINFYINNDVLTGALVNKYNKSHVMIHKILKENNIDYKKINADRRKLKKRIFVTKETKEDIKDFYINNNITIQEISIKYSITPNAIYGILRDYNIDYNKINNDRKIKNMEKKKLEKTKSEINKEKERNIIKFYFNNIVSIAEVSKKYNQNVHTIRNIFVRNKIDYNKIEMDRRNFKKLLKYLGPL